MDNFLFNETKMCLYTNDFTKCGQICLKAFHEYLLAYRDNTYKPGRRVSQSKFLYMKVLEKAKVWKGGLESFTANRYAALCFNQGAFLGVRTLHPLAGVGLAPEGL